MVPNSVYNPVEANVSPENLVEDFNSGFSFTTQNFHPVNSGFTPPKYSGFNAISTVDQQDKGGLRTFAAPDLSSGIRSGGHHTGGYSKIAPTVSDASGSIATNSQADLQSVRSKITAANALPNSGISDTYSSVDVYETSPNKANFDGFSSVEVYLSKSSNNDVDEEDVESGQITVENTTPFYSGTPISRIIIPAPYF